MKYLNKLVEWNFRNIHFLNVFIFCFKGQRSPHRKRAVCVFRVQAVVNFLLFLFELQILVSFYSLHLLILLAGEHYENEKHLEL
jgi:hypothetical protein